MRPGPGDFKHLRLAYTCALLQERFDDVIKMVKEGKECGVDLISMRTGPQESNGSEEPQLLWAVKNGYFNIAEFLLQQPGVNLEAKDKEGNAAIHFAAAYKANDVGEEDRALEVLEYLLVKGNRYCKDNHGNTPLHVAAMNGRVERVLLIINHNIDLSQRNKERKTALDLVPDSCTELKNILTVAMTKK